MNRKVVEDLQGGEQSAFRAYRTMTAGSGGFLFWLKYELVTSLFGGCPGALGLVLRRILYRSLFQSCGRGVLIGRNVTLRNPKKIELGDGAVLDDGCVLDAKGGDESGIRIGSKTFISRGAVLGCKGGAIRVGDRVSIGPYTIVHAVNGSDIDIGDCCVLAGYVYLVGGANYSTDARDVPIIEQPWKPGIGIRIGRDCWLGARVTVTDGSAVGEGCVIGAHSLVRKDLSPFSIAYGNPAVVHKER